jgi:hypothetical protein
MTEPIWIDSDLVPVIHDRQLAEQAGQKGCMTKRFCIRPSGARRVTWRPSPPTPWCWQANARQASSKITRLSMGSNAAILINGRVDQAESDRDSGGTAASFRRTT